MREEGMDLYNLQINCKKLMTTTNTGTSLSISLLYISLALKL